MNINPKISIVLPVYNVEKYINRALDSLLNQTFKDFEAIIVDDCGQDESIKIAKEYAEKDNRFKIFYHKKNLGTYHARKTGIDKSSGEYIVFLDPDDEFKLNALENLNYIIMSEKPDLILFDVYHVPKANWYNSFQKWIPKSKCISSQILSLAEYKIRAGAAGKLYRKLFLMKVLEKLKVSIEYRYIFIEDTLVFYAAVLERPKFSILNEYTYIYYNNDTSITAKGNNKDFSLLIEQVEFTLISLMNLLKTYDLSVKEQKYFDYVINAEIKSLLFLLKRYEGGKFDYFSNVIKSFYYQPKLTQFIRLIIFIISFGSRKI